MALGMLYFFLALDEGQCKAGVTGSWKHPGEGIHHGCFIRRVRKYAYQYPSLYQNKSSAIRRYWPSGWRAFLKGQEDSRARALQKTCFHFPWGFCSWAISQKVQSPCPKGLSKVIRICQKANKIWSLTFKVRLYQLPLSWSLAFLLSCLLQ